MGRSGADGLHVDDGMENVRAALEKFAPNKMVGAGNVTSRDVALRIGEWEPDYLFFGKIGGDIRPEAHPKNLEIAEWWAHVIELPCVVLGGTTPESALEVANTRADFVALSLAVFNRQKSPKEMVMSINQMLDENAPDLSVEIDGNT